MASAAEEAGVTAPVKIRSAKGFALIDLLFVCVIIGIISAIALPRLLKARQYAGAASAIGSMRAISSAELTYALTCGSGFYAPDLTTLGTPAPGSTEAFVSPNLSTSNSVTRAGYVIQVQATPYVGAPGSCNGLAQGAGGQGFKGIADALDADNHRYFAVNADAQIFENNSSLLGVMPELGDPPAGHVLR